MRLLIVMLSSFLCTNLFATMISSYYGAVYQSINLRQCESDFMTIRDQVESQNNFFVVEGGCVNYGEKHVRIQFSYSHPIIDRLERFEREMPNVDACYAELDTVKKSFEAIGYQFIFSYCDRKKLVVDFVDTIRHLIRDLKLGVSFIDQTSCLKYSSLLTTKLATQGVHTLVSSCNEISSYGTRLKYYIPQLSVSAHYKTKVEVLKGKLVSAPSTCFENTTEVSRNFDRDELAIVDLFCAPVLYSHQSREIIVYVEKTNEKVKDYIGQIYTSLSICEQQMANATHALVRTGRSVLYQYCDMQGENKFRPVIYHFIK